MADSESAALVVDRPRPDVARIRLNRLDRLNALSYEGEIMLTARSGPVSSLVPTSSCPTLLSTWPARSPPTASSRFA